MRPFLDRVNEEGEKGRARDGRRARKKGERKGREGGYGLILLVPLKARCQLVMLLGGVRLFRRRRGRPEGS